MPVCDFRSYGSAPHFVIATGVGLRRVTNYGMSLVMFGVLL